MYFKISTTIFILVKIPPNTYLKYGYLELKLGLVTIGLYISEIGVIEFYCRYIDSG